MEKRANMLLETFIVKFKDDIRDKVVSLGLPEEEAHEIIQFVYDYERPVLTNNDISKPKRTKTTIPIASRCSAKLANNEQCTRKRRKDCDFCGTHANSKPNGLMTNEEEHAEFLKSSNQKVEISAEDVNGIIYHVDSFGNAYNTEDILRGSENPRIVGTFAKGIITLL